LLRQQSLLSGAFVHERKLSIRTELRIRWSNLFGRQSMLHRAELQQWPMLLGLNGLQYGLCLSGNLLSGN
jgi:hypothetical protein